MRSSGGRSHRLPARVAVGSAAAMVAAGLAAVGLAAGADASTTHHGQAPAAAKGNTATGKTSAARRAGAHSRAGHQAPPAGTPLQRPKVRSGKARPHLVVTTVTPGSGTREVATNAPLTVVYSKPLSRTPPLPTLDPPVAGSWTASGSVLTFVPTGGWLPSTTETVTVPAGATATVHGVRATSTKPTTTTFTVQPGSELRLEQLLSELDYLPFTFTPSALPAGVTTGLGAEPTQADAVSTSPLPGTLNWSYPNIPPSLSALWTPGQPNVIDKGAIMAFESAENLTMDGVAGPKVWGALLAAVAARHATTQPYDYLMATETLPETLQVWRNGQIVYTSPANTGVTGATTQPGTFPVFERQATGTMTGTDPDGTHYVDPGIPWIAYFNGGDAVHGFVRAAYGYPQSNGCVELPVANAAQVWTMDPYGTLVTVLPPS